MKYRLVRPLTPVLLGLAALTMLVAAGCGSKSGTLFPIATRFQVTPLVGDLAGVAPHTDARLVNPWGIAFSATGPFWISNNHSNTSTLYDSDGNPQRLVVQIDGDGPTGTIFNNTTDFKLGTTGPALFVFSTEGGTLAAWNGASGTRAATVADRSAVDAVYKGLALANNNGQNLLYAADFHNGRVDMFDTNFHFAGSFTDSAMPVGFAPFNVQNIGGDLYVTFARQKGPDNEDDEAGAGNGFVDVFGADGTLLRRLISRGQLNSPWGLAIAPSGFGTLSGKLLVGNFGDGEINIYDPQTGAFVGTMLDANGAPVVLPGLWALVFGNGARGGRADTLYVTAGPNDETNGVFSAIHSL